MQTVQCLRPIVAAKGGLYLAGPTCSLFRKDVCAVQKAKLCLSQRKNCLAFRIKAPCGDHVGASSLAGHDYDHPVDIMSARDMPGGFIQGVKRGLMPAARQIVDLKPGDFFHCCHQTITKVVV